MHETLMAVDLMRLRAIQVCRDVAVHARVDTRPEEALGHVADRLLELELSRPVLYREIS